MKIVSAKYVYDRLSEKNCSINAVFQITDSRTTTVHVPLPKPPEEGEKAMGDTSVRKENKHYKRAIKRNYYENIGSLIHEEINLFIYYSSRSFLRGD